MSTDDPNARENDRPKFDDVASLFGDIVPPPGTPVRSRLASLRRPSLPDANGPAILAPPPRLTTPVLSPDHVALPAFPPAVTGVPTGSRVERVLAEPGLPPVERTPPRPLPPRGGDRAERPRKSKGKAGASSVPWPDAFDPKPNYRRKPTSRYWAWLVLVPFLAVVAIGIFMVNPQTIRAFVDTHFPHLQHPVTEPVTSLLPAPFRDTPTSNAAAPAEPAPATSNAPVPAPSEPVTAPAAAPSNEPAPPQAATPVPVVPPAATSPEAPSDATPPATTSPPAAIQPSPAPSTESPALADAPAPLAPALIPAPPAPAPVSSAISRVTVHYRRSEADGRRVATQMEKLAGTVDLRSGTSAYRSPTVVYYTPLDRDAATAVARILGDSWSIRAGPGRPTPGSLDLWLP